MSSGAFQNETSLLGWDLVKQQVFHSHLNHGIVTLRILWQEWIFSKLKLDVKMKDLGKVKMFYCLNGLSTLGGFISNNVQWYIPS